jgi:uncharacterized hydantoinase/oxoprolinase family protein
MRAEKWEVVDEVAGELQAELIRGILEAQEIEVVLSQEGIGRVYATTVGAFGRVQILVSAKDVSLARQILDQYYSNEPSDELSGDGQSLDTPES